MEQESKMKFLGFYGNYEHSIDPKGRVIIPAAFRHESTMQLMIAKSTENCISIYTLEQWERLSEKIDALLMSDDDAQDFVRWFYSSAMLCELDKNFRILISPDLREHAGLDKDIVILGLNRRAEIWDKNAYEAHKRGETFQNEYLKRTMKKLSL